MLRLRSKDRVAILCCAQHDRDSLRLERVIDFPGERDLFFGGLPGLWGFFECRVGSEARIIDLLGCQQFLDAQDLDARISVCHYRDR